MEDLINDGFEIENGSDKDLHRSSTFFQKQPGRPLAAPEHEFWVFQDLDEFLSPKEGVASAQRSGRCSHRYSRK